MFIQRIKRWSLQIRSHAQKYFLKVQKNGTSEHVPPPRPKRKAAHPYPQKASKNGKNVSVLFCLVSIFIELFSFSFFLKMCQLHCHHKQPRNFNLHPVFLNWVIESGWIHLQCLGALPQVQPCLRGPKILFYQ